MGWRRCGYVLALGFLATVVASSPAAAQKTTGDITGTIADASGAILPGANISAVCTETNLTRTGVSDAQGGYRLSELPICTYKVTAELTGFKSVTREALVQANGIA